MSSTKLNAQCRHYLAELRRLVKRQGRSVSAGELAKEMGVSRTTAIKYLRELIKSDKVGTTLAMHVNMIEITRYYPEVL